MIDEDLKKYSHDYKKYVQDSYLTLLKLYCVLIIVFSPMVHIVESYFPYDMTGMLELRLSMVLISIIFLIIVNFSKSFRPYSCYLLYTNYFITLIAHTYISLLIGWGTVFVVVPIIIVFLGPIIFVEAKEYILILITGIAAHIIMSYFWGEYNTLFGFLISIFYVLFSVISIVLMIFKVRLFKNEFISRKKAETAQDKLAKALILTEKLARTDELTSLANRRCFYDKINQVFNEAIRYKNSFSVCMLDLDYFKKINDKYGHAGGDEVLKAVSTILSELSRQTDMPARIGGEEFAILMPHSDLPNARKLAARIRKKLELTDIVYNEQIINCTISVGIAQFETGMDSVDQLIAKADNLLYKAKKEGRNMIVS